MKTIVSLCLLMLISLANAKNINIAYHNTHSTQQTMSMDKDTDCCPEGIHISCGFTMTTNTATVVLQEVVNSMSLATPVFKVFYTSFIAKIPTPPPTV
ncbi:MAG: hypothetical protein FE834_08330 [Gammaproteobacteria bacterium]|nr:hypothetical protein [Gammaproteobacteria bacterium]